MAHAPPARLRSTGGAALWAQRLLLLYALIAAASFAVTLVQGLSPSLAGEALSLLDFAGFAAAAALVLRWLYLASVNARALGATDLTVGPGWAVGWFFVPIANLFMPYIAVRDLWKASASPRDWQIESAPATIGWWWAAWIGSGLAGSIAFQLSLAAVPDAASAGLFFELVSTLFAIPSALLLARIIGGIEAMQARAAPRMVFA